MTKVERLSIVAACTMSLLFTTMGCYRNLPSDLDGLVAAMESNDMGVQAAAAKRIDQMYGERGLLYALESQGPGARAQAARRLSRFKSGDVVKALEKVATSDENRQARYAAVDALGVIGDPLALDTVSRLRKDPDPVMRAAAEEAFQKLQRRN